MKLFLAEKLKLLNGSSGKSNPCKLATFAYLSALFFGLPLVFHNGYFDITETKYAFFVCLSVLYVLCVCICRLVFHRYNNRALPMESKSLPIDWLIGLFALLCTASVLCSENVWNALWGVHNRWQGLLTMLLYLSIVELISRFPSFSIVCSDLLSGSFLLVNIIAVVNALGWDPFGMLQNLAPADSSRYISTLGNINFFGSYLGVLFPVVLCQFCFAKEPPRKIFLAVCCCAGMFGICLSSDGVGLALAASIILLPLLLANFSFALKRLAGFLPVLVLCLFIGGQLFSGGSSRFFPPHFIRFFCSLPCAFAICCLSAVCFIVSKTKVVFRSKLFQRNYGIFWIFVTLLAIVFILLANTAWQQQSFGGLDRFIKWNAGWGTDRGKIWRYCMQLFGRYHWWQQMIGGGPGCLYALDAKQPLFADAILDSAHNEYLQMLLVYGIAGCIVYVSVLLATIIAGIREGKKNPSAIGWTAGFVCYCVQAVVNIAQPVSTPYLFVLMGLIWGVSRSSARSKSPVL